ncbi:MAG TPA: histidine--tRNA ligase [Deltaproteobacteria bacterium]|nr:histidine--tRNA ligase [Deltaproteobacteria bacterium]
MEINAIKGMNDILPGDIAKWHFVENTARRIFHIYGFTELRTPVLERTELFFRGIGDDTDVVEKQMYTFTDKSGTAVALRPEATASVLRSVIEHGLLGTDPIQKLYSMGPMFRYERPQKGRYRQFHQINVERLGEDSPSSDAETLSMAYALALALGLKGLKMEVNSLGCDDCRQEFKRALIAFLKDKEKSLCSDCSRRMKTNPLRVLDCKVVSCRQAVEGAPAIEDFLCEGCRVHYNKVQDALRSFDVPFEKNPRLVRGLDYYTKTTFELTAEGLGSQNAVAGGGRYDNLVKTLGGPDVSGIGFAFGIERIIMLLDHHAPEKKGCFVVLQEDDAVQAWALEVLSMLRTAYIPAEAAFKKSFKAQMRKAGKSGYPLCIILGQAELEKSMVTIKDLRDSSQIQVSRTEALKKIRSMLDKQGEKK